MFTANFDDAFPWLRVPHINQRSPLTQCHFPIRRGALSCYAAAYEFLPTHHLNIRNEQWTRGTHPAGLLNEIYADAFHVPGMPLVLRGPHCSRRDLSFYNLEPCITVVLYDVKFPLDGMHRLRGVYMLTRRSIISRDRSGSLSNPSIYVFIHMVELDDALRLFSFPPPATQFQPMTPSPRWSSSHV